MRSRFDFIQNHLIIIPIPKCTTIHPCYLIYLTTPPKPIPSIRFYIPRILTRHEHYFKTIKIASIGRTRYASSVIESIYPVPMKHPIVVLPVPVLYRRRVVAAKAATTLHTTVCIMIHHFRNRTKVPSRKLHKHDCSRRQLLGYPVTYIIYNSSVSLSCLLIWYQIVDLLPVWSKRLIQPLLVLKEKREKKNGLAIKLVISL